MDLLKNKHALYPVLIAGLFLTVALGYHLFSIPVCSLEVTQKPHTVIVTAFEVESNAVLEKVETVGICRKNGIVYHHAEYAGNSILIYESGIGRENAQKTTDLTLSDFTVSLLVFSGIAGSVDSSLPIGGVVVAEEWVDAESGESIRIDASLIEKARAFDTVRIVTRGATFDEFVTNTETIPEGVSVVDMETTSIARTAQKHNVPFIAFRGISDYVGKEEKNDSFQNSANESAKVTLEYVSTF